MSPKYLAIFRCLGEVISPQRSQNGALRLNTDHFQSTEKNGPSDMQKWCSKAKIPVYKISSGEASGSF